MTQRGGAEMALKQRGSSGQGQQLAPGPQPHLHVTAVQVHPADHAALGRHIRPVNHLLSVIEVQGDGIVEALHLGGEQRGDRRVRMRKAGEVGKEDGHGSECVSVEGAGLDGGVRRAGLAPA